MQRVHKVIEILKEYVPEYLKQHRVDRHKLHVISTTIKCWDHELGHVVFACPDGCGDIHTVAATCKLRFCYFCGYSQQLRWLASLGDFLPRCPYTMITFTLPLFIRPFFKADMKTMVDILFESAFYGVQTYAKRHQFYAGMIAVLQLVGSLLHIHPHIHMVLPLGGLSLDGTTWKPYDCYHAVTISRYYTSRFIELLKKAIRKGMALPEEYRALQEAGLLIAYLDDQMDYHEGLRQQNLKNRSKHSHFIKRHVIFTESQSRAWNVYVSPSPKNQNSQSIPIAYIGRYMKTPPITSARIREYTRDRVMITVKDPEFGGKKNQTMSRDAFMEGILISIPPKSLQIVRRSGLFANTQRPKLAKAKDSLERDFKEMYREVADPNRIVEFELQNYRERQKGKTGLDPMVCSCGKTKVRVGMVYAGGVVADWILSQERVSYAKYNVIMFWYNDS